MSALFNYHEWFVFVVFTTVFRAGRFLVAFGTVAVSSRNVFVAEVFLRLDVLAYETDEYGFVFEEIFNGAVW